MDQQMEYLLGEGIAIDTSTFPRSAEGWYIFDSFIPSCQYCDATLEAWIRSIAVELATMRIYASITDDLHNRHGFQCLYLG
jgi:hypothetical protein